MAASTTKTKKKLARKTEKRYDNVRFTLDFIDGEFVAPNFNQVPIKVVRKIMNEDPEPLFQFLAKHGEKGVVTMLDEFDFDEFEEFIGAWQKASEANLGK